MALFAACPRCGLSVTVLDLGEGPARCPACAAELEEVPDADRVAEGPPLPPPLPTSSSSTAAWDWSQARPVHLPDMPDKDGLPPGPSPRPLSPGWRSVVRGLGMVQVGLILFFAGWGVLVLAAFALTIYAMIDQNRARELLDGLSLLGSGLGILVYALFVVGRLYCTAFDEKHSSGRGLAWFSAGATLVAALSWIALLLLFTPWLADAVSPETQILGWFVALGCNCLGEVMFLLLVRELGRCLKDRHTQDRVGRFFTGLGLFIGLVLVGMVVVPLVGFVILPGLGARGFLVFDLVMLAAVVLAGIGITTLVVRYLQAVNAARLAISQRLAALAVTTTG
jgi:hypothetical protein